MMPAQRRDGSLYVTVAHLDDAIKAGVAPVTAEISDLRLAFRDLSEDVHDVLQHLDNKPSRRFRRWVFGEMRALHAAAAGAVVSGAATYLLFHFLP